MWASLSAGVFCEPFSSLIVVCRRDWFCHLLLSPQSSFLQHCLMVSRFVCCLLLCYTTVMLHRLSKSTPWHVIIVMLLFAAASVGSSTSRLLLTARLQRIHIYIAVAAAACKGFFVTASADFMTVLLKRWMLSCKKKKKTSSIFYSNVVFCQQIHVSATQAQGPCRSSRVAVQEGRVFNQICCEKDEACTGKIFIVFFQHLWFVVPWCDKIGKCFLPLARELFAWYQLSDLFYKAWNLWNR